MWTIEFDRFVAPARGSNGLWRLVAGLVLVILVWGVGVVAMLGAVGLAVGPDGLEAWLGRIASADTPTAVLVMLGTFAGMFAGPLLAARWLHGRPGRSLFGARLWRGFATGAVIAAALFALAALAMPWPFAIVRNLPTGLFLSFLPLALAGLLLQTGAEELLFRSYLQGQLAARFAHPLVWMVGPALLFGALHYDPATAGGNAGWVVASATLFGLVAADLVRVTGSIGAGWGLHFVNNASAMLVVSIDGSLSGLSLWTMPMPVDALPGIVLAQDMAFTLIVWACIRLWLARAGRSGGVRPG